MFQHFLNWALEETMPVQVFLPYSIPEIIRYSSYLNESEICASSSFALCLYLWINSIINPFDVALLTIATLLSYPHGGLQYLLCQIAFGYTSLPPDLQQLMNPDAQSLKRSFKYCALNCEGLEDIIQTKDTEQS